LGQAFYNTSCVGRTDLKRRGPRPEEENGKKATNKEKTTKPTSFQTPSQKSRRAHFLGKHLGAIRPTDSKSTTPKRKTPAGKKKQVGPRTSGKPSVSPRMDCTQKRNRQELIWLKKSERKAKTAGDCPQTVIAHRTFTLKKSARQRTRLALRAGKEDRPRTLEQPGRSHT